MSDGFRSEGMDLTRLWLRFLSKIWVVILVSVLGVVIAGGSYRVYYHVTDAPRYGSVSKIYLDFAADETGEVYQYYNGYTWNDLMSTSPIIDMTMQGLEHTKIDRGQVEAAVKAEILSDIRLLTITVSAEDETECTQIRDAVLAALEEHGASAKEFLDIRVIKQGDVIRIHADDRIKQARLLGALCGLVISLLVLAFYYVLDDRILVPGDVTRRFGIPVIGVLIRQSEDKEDSLAAGLKQDYEEDLEYLKQKKACEEVLVLDIAELVKKADETSKEADAPAYDKIREASAVVLKIPYGKVRATALERILERIRFRDGEVDAIVIYDVESSFYRFYGMDLMNGKAKA